MIVYGDPRYVRPAGRMLRRLREAAQSAGSAPDDSRAALLQAGCLEQAVADQLPEHGAAVQRVTDCFADRFETLRRGAPDDRANAARLRRALAELGLPEEHDLTVRVPEGFAFYALFPEQYAAAALRWAARYPQGRVLVVGLRSIGTTLSAVVAAALRREGRAVRRLTVRPAGHPFAREVELPAGVTAGAEWALVVDEGPGLSGSSMAAAAEALVRAGLRRDQVAFLPGHAHGPGTAASPEVRKWWETTPRFLVPPEEIRWEGRTLHELLAERSQRLCPAAGAVISIEDLGGGAWRGAVFGDPDAWPAAFAPFELPKLRCVFQDGSALLWKFAGLSGEEESPAAAAAARLRAGAAAGWMLAPREECLGFVAVPWVGAPPLTSADAAPGVLRQIGEYLAWAAGPPVSPDEAAAAQSRLGELLAWNSVEALGEEAREPARVLIESAAAWLAGREPPQAGDGRLAPVEWRLQPSGRLLKLDGTGHHADHTAVGRQPLWWDVAGAEVEWELGPKEAALLRRSALPPQLLAAPDLVLRFYRAAYAAFRVGQASLCEGAAADPREQARLRTAGSFYRRALARELRTP
ncbi:MAG: hypothetical protein ACK47B_15870 [Armatimonadota bacterium]